MLKMWVGSRWRVHSLASSLASVSLLASLSLSSLSSSLRGWSCSCSWLTCSIDGNGVTPAAATSAGANVVGAGGWMFCCCGCSDCGSRSCCWCISGGDCASCGCDSACCCTSRWAAGGSSLKAEALGSADVLGTLDDAAVKSSRRGFLAPPDCSTAHILLGHYKQLVANMTCSFQTSHCDTALFQDTKILSDFRVFSIISRSR